MEEKEVLTILFERKVLKKTENGIVYTYLPLEIINGTELNFNDNKTLKCNPKRIKTFKHANPDNSSEMDISYMGDIYNLDSKYVYGFSIDVSNQTEEEKKAYKDYLRKELIDIKKHIIFQTYRDYDGWSKFFISMDDLNLEIDPEYYFGIQELIYGLVDEFKDDLTTTIKENYPRITKPSIVTTTTSLNALYADDLYNSVRKTVICQDEQIKTVATALAKNSRLTDGSLKSNILVCGPTGVGKSEMFRTISRNFNIPMAIEDSNEYTAASYKGKDMEEMLIHLYRNANNDLERAERGILVIDEIDKKASNGEDHETFKSAVINSLLKMMEGHTYNISVPGGSIDFDTSLLTFVFLGAFSGIEEFSDKRRTLGFMSDEEKAAQKDKHAIYSEKTLEKYGLLPEFLGRSDSLVIMDKLGMEELIKIIKMSDKSQLLLYKNLFRDMGIKFLYDDKVIEAIARKAMELNLGARSIKKIVEEALEEASFQVFSKNCYSSLTISEETIEDNKQYILK